MGNILLSCDTSTNYGSICLFDADKKNVVHQVEWEKSKSHSEVITTKFQELLNTSDISIKDINNFACGVGPGSFTGIRVGLNFIKSLSFGTKHSVFGINSLKVIAAEAINKTDLPILVGTYGFQDIVYLAAYKFNIKTNKLDEIIKPQAQRQNGISKLLKEDFLFLGTAYDKLSFKSDTELSSRLHRDTTLFDKPKASNLSLVIQNECEISSKNTWRELSPLYIRASEAEEKLRKGIIKAHN